MIKGKYKNIKKPLALLMAFGSMFATSGCGSNEPEPAETEMKVIEAPADGWTHEQLSEVIYLCGTPFSLPCTVEELEARGFSIAESFDLDLKFQDKMNTTSDIFPSDSEIYAIQFKYQDSSELLSGWYCINENEERVIWTINAAPTSYDNEPTIFFNGITANDDFPTVTKALGENYYQKGDSASHIYDIRSDLYQNERLYIMAFDESRILWIGYSLY